MQALVTEEQVPKDEIRKADTVQRFEWPQGQAEPGFPLEPFEDVVILEQVTEEKSKGGLILPNEAGKMPMGRVVAVGPGKFYHAPFNAAESHAAVVFVPTRLNVGDMVSWGRYRTGGEPWEFNGKTYVAAREGDPVVACGRTLTGRCPRSGLSRSRNAECSALGAWRKGEVL